MSVFLFKTEELEIDMQFVLHTVKREILGSHSPQRRDRSGYALVFQDWCHCKLSF